MDGVLMDVVMVSVFVAAEPVFVVKALIRDVYKRQESCGFISKIPPSF